MTKTIEEAAKEFMQTAPIEAISPYYEEDMAEMFKGGVEYALLLPLAQRLTAEEKERVRKIYYDAERGEVNGHYDVYPDPCEVLRVIFGADFFKEEE